jgi:hypothetical protein
MSVTAEQTTQEQTYHLRRLELDACGHRLCPACGGTASLDALILSPELRPYGWTPRCDSCGLTWPTGKTLDTIQWDTWEKLSEASKKHITDQAWISWDRAWWTGSTTTQR